MPAKSTRPPRAAAAASSSSSAAVRRAQGAAVPRSSSNSNSNTASKRSYNNSSNSSSKKSSNSSSGSKACKTRASTAVAAAKAAVKAAAKSTHTKATAKSANTAAATATASRSRRSHTVQGTLTRSPDALASLALKRTEQELWKDVVPFVRRTRSDDSEFDSATMLKLVTWNVAGLRGLLKRNGDALTSLVARVRPDVLCLQETKLNADDAEGNAALGVLDGYTFVDHPCVATKGYSGTRTYTRDATVTRVYAPRTTRGFVLPHDGNSCTTSNSSSSDAAVHDDEGRVLTTFLSHAGRSSNSSGAAAASSSSSAWSPALAIVNTYVPNSGMTLDRLPYRTEMFDARMRTYLQDVQTLCTSRSNNNSSNNKSDSATRRERSTSRSQATSNASSTATACAAAGEHTTTPTTATTTAPTSAIDDTVTGGFVWTGDLNVAERDYDRYYAGTYRSMQECSGFTPEERQSFRQTLHTTHAVDALRLLYPHAGPCYTFWSQRINGRARNLGWRLDYFVLSANLARHVVECAPMPDVMGSDHCPVQLWLRKL